ncbi:MAG: uncharacterized protein H6R10_2339 [Rhodocyclaceae bacterium]|nr:uncharacterized protein [Rhodocyclaceae bacterium]
MKRIQASDLAALSRDASKAPRRRSNLNLHPELADPVQRLLNAIEPGSYVPPHRHGSPAKWELFVILSGAIAVLIFDGEGKVLERVELDADGPTRMVEIPPAAWHSAVALRAGTVVLEVKPGPYAALASEDFASWAPKDGTEEAAALVERLARAGVGECLG